MAGRWQGPNESSIGGEDAEGGGGVAIKRVEACWFHAAARAISGGPVYVSDYPGQVNNGCTRTLVVTLVPFSTGTLQHVKKQGVQKM